MSVRVAGITLVSAVAGARTPETIFLVITVDEFAVIAVADDDAGAAVAGAHVTVEQAVGVLHPGLLLRESPAAVAVEVVVLVIPTAAVEL